MTLLKDILKHEVMPAMGCTEPIAVALAAAYARDVVGGKVWRIAGQLDSGSFKNGMNVAIPGTDGVIGIPIAAALGAICGDPKDELKVLQNVKKSHLKEAKKLLTDDQVNFKPNFSKKYLYIRVKVKTDKGEGVAKIARGHTHLIELRKNGKLVSKDPKHKKGAVAKYKAKIRRATLEKLVEMAREADSATLKYMAEGVEMNLEASELGMKYKGYGWQLREMLKSGDFKKSVFSETKIAVAAAADGRMAGMEHPVMSSGGSGNQGLVSILVPYFFSQYHDVGRKRMLQSIVLSHLLNSYVKSHAGALSPICHCAVAAGVGAAAACVFQKSYSLEKISFAINNIANDLGGMLCNGANSGCAVKVATSSAVSLESALAALNGYCVSGPNGIIGGTPEETLKNLAMITKGGMGNANKVILDIMGKQCS